MSKKSHSAAGAPQCSSSTAIKRVTIFVNSTLVCALLTNCNATQKNLLLGVQENQVGTHWIKVTDCYRMGKEQPETTRDAQGNTVYRFAPCRDAVIEINENSLIVSGKAYGLLNSKDRVSVDHHQVLINDQAANEIARR